MTKKTKKIFYLFHVAGHFYFYFQENNVSEKAKLKLLLMQ